MTELTDEQIAREEKFLEGIPRLNIGALFLPPIWGPAHGMWAAILFYPIWLFADNTFYAAFTERTPLAIGIALIVLLTLTVGTVVFAIWTIASVIAGIAMIAAATYYNLVIRPTVGA